MALPQGPNQRWSLDFLSDAFADGRRFRILAIVDDFTRECLTLVPASSGRGYRGVVEFRGQSRSVSPEAFPGVWADERNLADESNARDARRWRVIAWIQLGVTT